MTDDTIRADIIDGKFVLSDTSIKGRAWISAEKTLDLADCQ